MLVLVNSDSSLGVCCHAYIVCSLLPKYRLWGTSGAGVGDIVGALVGCLVGVAVGCFVGTDVGAEFGLLVSGGAVYMIGAFVGDWVGVPVSTNGNGGRIGVITDGTNDKTVGKSIGTGTMLGTVDRDLDGMLGTEVIVGSNDGLFVGTSDLRRSCWVGLYEGYNEGISDSTAIVG